MIEKIIIDLDGPILDGKQRHYQCYSDILQTWDFQPVSLNEYWEMKRAGINRRELLSYSGAESIYDKFLARWLLLIEEKKYLSLDKLQHQAFQILKNWQERNLQVILVTLRQHQQNLNWQLDTLKLSPLLNQVIRVDLENGSAKANAVRPILDNKDLNKIVWIGDTELDIDSARLIGVKAAAVSCGVRNEDYLIKSHPDYLEPNLFLLASKLGMLNV